MATNEGKVHIMINRPPPRAENSQNGTGSGTGNGTAQREDDPNARNFWTKNRTECLLNLLADQAQTNGDIDHDSVAIKMTDMLNLKSVLSKNNIVERLDSMFQIFQKELLKENQNKVRSTWIWMKQLQFLVDLIQEKEDGKSTEKSRIQNQNLESPVKVEEPVKTAKRPVISRNPGSSRKPEVTVIPDEKVQNNISVIRQNRTQNPASNPHPVIVPLKPEVVSENSDQIKVDIKIGIKPTFSTSGLSTSGGGQPMMIAVKTGSSETPILIPKNYHIPKEPKKPINNSVLKVVQKEEERPIPVPVISGNSVLEESKKSPQKTSTSGSLPVSDLDSPPVIRSSKILRSAPDEGRNRMPDLHVDFLLRKYRNYLEERMLESGRLSKGTFNEIANDLNKQFNVQHYEREQVASKLQNLKTQFRQKRNCVENGNDPKSELEWKWYDKLEDIMQIESSARDQSEAFRPISENFRNSAENGEIDSEKEEIRTNGTKRHRTPPRTTRPRAISDSEKVQICSQVVSLVDTSSDEEDQKSNILKNERNPKKVKIDPQIMDEALFNLISNDSENCPSGDHLRARLKDKKSELLKLRILAFNLFHSVTDMLKTIED